MARDLLRALGIATTLIGIVFFFAAIAPSNENSEDINAMEFEVNQTSAVLENLIMTHSESVGSFMISYGECETN